MNLEPLTREEMIRVIEGKGCARRIPMLYHCWILPQAFERGRREQVLSLLDYYPDDAQLIDLRMPLAYDPPEDDPSYQWNFRRGQNAGKSLDNAGFIEDWDTDLEPFLADFPDPEYPGLIPPSPAHDGRYRLGRFWYFFFERFWSIRSMADALTDFYLYPEAVHTLFDHLADFYIRAITRAKQELDLDGLFVSDDLGTQASTFFSPEVFDEFFRPYYKRVIDHVHSLGMHFWLHTCGNVKSIIPALIGLGIDVLHPIQKYTMDEKEIAGQFGDQITIWAGFDVQKIIPFGTPEQVRREVRYLIDTYRRDDGRFMLTMGNGTTPDTPVESLAALFDESIRYGCNLLFHCKGGACDESCCI